jgi:hypothetical protein
MEGGRAVTTRSSGYMDLGFVYECHVSTISKGPRRGLVIRVRRRLFGWRIRAHDADDLPAAHAMELDLAGDLCEQRVVAAFTDVEAGMNPRPPLANDDRAGRNLLTAEGLEPEPLRG